MRDVKEGVIVEALGSTFALMFDGERRVPVLLMYVKARVRAPATEVVGERSSGFVSDIREVRDWVRASRMRRNGR